MYIMKRPSRGRGEYELAEDFGSVSPGDLVGRTLYLGYGPYGVKTTGIVVARQGGKLRLRREDAGYIHIHRQVQAALLFPKSIRDEELLAGGQPTIMRGRYLVQRMHFGSLRTTDTTAEIELSTLELNNGSQQAEEVDFRSRIGRVRRLHHAAAATNRLPPTLAASLREHRTLLRSNAPVPARAEELIEQMMNEMAELAPDYDLEYTNGMDVVLPLEEILRLPRMEAPVPIASIPPDDVEIRVREAARWRRWAAARGPASAVFRRKVRRAYGSRCVVCGLRLPQNEFCRVPGVDSAHILPWTGFDIDVVPNGLCLCKTHHWAFDQQLIAIVYDADGTYGVKVTRRARDALRDDPDSLHALHSVEGAIPATRLPARREDWPSPNLLAKLYEDVSLD